MLIRTACCLDSANIESVLPPQVTRVMPFDLATAFVIVFFPLQSLHLVAEAILDFRVWRKSPCVGCYFRNISDGGKFVLYASDKAHDRRYTPRDAVFDFSEAGIENGLFRIGTRKTRTGNTTWQSAALLFGPDQQEAIAAYIRGKLW